MGGGGDAQPSPRWWKRFSRRSSVRSGPVEPAPLLSPVGATLSPFGIAGGASRSRRFPGSVGAVLSVLPTRASRARWPAFGCGTQAQVVGAGVGSRCHHGDPRTGGADGRPHPQRHLLLSSVQHRHSASWATVVGVEGCLFACDRLASATLSAQIAARKPPATRMLGPAGRCSMHGILTSRRVRYMHALSVLLG